ncbi:hypothetical protein KAR91_17740, partial [Candidatus Pacearchaeota archaeon]|nr:hypothetical protein [Candidatus Pacearchaeota archaeon]
MSELTDKKLSEEPVATSMLSTDIVSGIVNSKSVQIPPEVLKEIINSFEQVFAQNVEVLGAHKAVSYDGDGALLVNLTSPGPGGSEATANLTLRCNSGGLNPSSQILGQKHNDFIFYADENGFGLKSGIPYTHEDDAIPFDKDLNLLGKELLQSKTILDQQVNPYFNFNGVSGNILVADDPSFAELFANGGTYICKFNAFSTGETSAGMFFEKILQLFFTGGEWRVYVPFSGTIGDWLSTGVNIPLNLDTTVVLIYNGSNVSNNPTLYVDGVEVTLTETSTPVGTITTDVGTDLYIGSRPAGSRTFDGNKYKEIFLNRELTAAEAKSFSSNPQKALYFADIGGSNINVVTGTDSTFAGAGNWVDGNLGTFDVNSTVPGKAYMLGDGGNDYMYLTGVFTLGKAYRITLKAELLVGASTELLVGNSIVTVGNDTFGITPTGSELTYTGIIVPSTTTLVIGRNASIGGFNGVSFSIDDVEVTQLGATLVLEGKNATSNVWHDSANGLKGIVSGATLQNEQVVHRGEPYNWIINGDH